MLLAWTWALWRPLLCSSLCSRAYDMARSSSRVLACVLLALACSTMLCFVGTTPSPAAGSTPLKQSLRAPAVQMEARGGGEGALGDMSPDTYIIGITVLCVASLFANISGFFNPWEDWSREWQWPQLVLFFKHPSHPAIWGMRSVAPHGAEEQANWRRNWGLEGTDGNRR